MLSPVYRLFYHLALATDRELAKQVQYLKVQNRILRDKLPKKITITRSERARLLKFGKPVRLAIHQLVTIVIPSTFVRWVREAKDRKAKKTPKTGRPKKPLDLKQLILKIARENRLGLYQDPGRNSQADDTQDLTANRGQHPPRGRF